MDKNYWTGLILIILIVTSYVYWRSSRSLSYIQTLGGLNKFDVILPTRGFNDILGNACKWPIISPNESDITEFLYGTKNFNCQSKMPQVASLSTDGFLTINFELFEENVTCFYSELTSSEDSMDYRIGQEYQILPNSSIFIPFTQFIVACRSSASSRVEFLKSFVNFAAKFELNENETAKGFEEANMENPSLSILLLNSVSYNQFIRHLSMTREFMQENDFISASMFNKIADDSFQNTMSIVTGEKVPETDSPDKYEGLYLWNAMKERGCIASLNDDISFDGPFYQKIDKIDKFNPNVDFFMRGYHLFNQRKMIVRNSQCMKDGTIVAEEYIKLWKDFSLRFKRTCHFSLSYINGLTRNNPTNLAAIDSVLRTALEQLKANGLFETTTFVIMSDTGNRISRISKTFTGKIEERNPFFIVRMPSKFRRFYPRQMLNLEVNANRLISNFDIHAMLHDYATMNFLPEDALEDPEVQNLKSESKGLSLFRFSLPAYRSCADLGIPPHFCLCMDEKEERQLQFPMSSDIYNTLYSQIREDLLQNETCLAEVSKHDDWTTMKIFTLNPMVLHGLRSENEWHKIRNSQVEVLVEFFEIGVMAFAPKSKLIPMDRPRNMAILSRFRHYLKDQKIEQAGNKMIIWTNDGCIIKEAHRYCEMCYNHALLS